MTPYELSILMDCWTRVEIREKPTPLLTQTLESFVANGLITDVENHHATDRAVAHIEYLLSRPWPVQKWVRPPESENDGHV